MFSFSFFNFGILCQLCVGPCYYCCYFLRSQHYSVAHTCQRTFFQSSHFCCSFLSVFSEFSFSDLCWKHILTNASMCIKIVYEDLLLREDTHHWTFQNKAQWLHHVSLSCFCLWCENWQVFVGAFSEGFVFTGWVCTMLGVKCTKIYIRYPISISIGKRIM